MKTLSVGELLSRAWELSVKYWPIFVVLTIVESISSGFGISVDNGALAEIASADDPSSVMEAYSEAITLSPWFMVAVLLKMYLSFVCVRMYANAVQTGRPYESFGDVLRCDIMQLATFIVVGIALGIIISVGLMACLLPGIILGVRLMYAPYLVVVEKASFAEAFKHSWALTAGHFWELLLTLLVYVGVLILGYCACCVGIIFAEVVAQFLLMVTFFQLSHFAGKCTSPIGGNAVPYDNVIEM